MSLKIRLARGGSKKRPYYHVVVADARSLPERNGLRLLQAFPRQAHDECVESILRSHAQR